jgi:hypothetical protein
MSASPDTLGPVRRPGRSYAPSQNDVKPTAQFFGKEDLRVQLLAAARAARVGRGRTARLSERLDALLATGEMPFVLMGLAGARWAVEERHLPLIAERLGLPVPAIDTV